MGVLDHLIAPKRPKRKSLAATLRSPLGMLLLPQFERLGLTAGTVRYDGPTGSAWSRGYVLGAACASLQHQGAAPASDHECFATALTAFTMTYGEADARNLLAATVAAAEAHEPEIEDGLMQGASDLALVATGQADGIALQFATRNGEELGEVI
jgi:phytoene dehydrogenase-like protein